MIGTELIYTSPSSKASTAEQTRTKEGRSVGAHSAVDPAKRLRSHLWDRDDVCFI